MFRTKLPRNSAAKKPRSILKDATSCIHQRLDDLIDQSDAFKSRAGYQQFLIGSAIGHRTIETIIAASAVDCGMELPTPLRSELSCLDAEIDPLTLPVLTGVDTRIETRASLLGRYYVLEGSSLGGKVLVRRLQSFGIDAGAHGRFLSGDIINASERWRLFLSLTEAWTPTDQDMSEAIDAAIDTFEVFIRAYESVL